MPSAPDRVSGPTRRDPLWLIVLAGVLMVARVGAAMYEDRHPAERPDLVTWVDPAEAPRASREDGKPILYDFSAAWCGPCRTMEREVFAEKRHARTIDHLVVPVRIVDRLRETGSNEPYVDSLQQALDVRSYPTLVVVADGRVVDRTAGYRGADETAQWIARAAAKSRFTDPRDSTGAGIRLRFP